MSIGGSTARRRPKDRKAQILQAARELIVEVGYPNVSIAMIADRVGITAGAMYRHFANKAVLLEAVIDRTLSEVTPAFESHDTLEAALTRSCASAVANRDVGVLWWREARNLPADRRHKVRDQLLVITRAYSDLIAELRPQLDPTQVNELAWGVQAILTSAGSHTSSIPDADYTALMIGCCRRLCAAELSAPTELVARGPSPLQAQSKREALLGHAIVLFDDAGYEATGLDDIGAAAGVSGPNLYSYFDNKAAVLHAAVERGTSALWLLLHRVLDANDDPEAALIDLLRGYIQLALDRTILTLLLQTDQNALPDDAHARQREYLAEWSALLRAARPELDPRAARVLVHTALHIVHSLARITHLQKNASFPDDLLSMCSAALLP